MTLRPVGQQAYRPYGGCLEAWKSSDLEVLVSGPAGTGKSRSILEKIHFVCESWPGARALIARQTRDSLTDTVLVDFEESVLPPGHPCMDGSTREHRHSYRYPNGSEVVLGGFNKPTRLMSSQYDIVYIPEATEVALRSWEKVLTRCRNFVVPVQQLIADCNPDSPDHWLYLRHLDGMRLIETTHRDNARYFDHSTGEWTSEGQAYLKTLERLTGYERERLLHGKWAAPPGQVYSCFDRAAHRVPRFHIPKTWRRFYGLDFGDVNAAAVCLAEHPTEKCSDGWPVLYAYRSYWPSEQLKTSTHVGSLKEREGDGWGMVQAAGGNRTTESSWRREWAMAGLHVAEPRVSAVDVQVQRTFDTMARGGLKFFNDCHTLIGHVTGLRRSLDGFGNPIDGKYDNDKELHLAAALRYIVSHVRYETKAKTKVHSPFMKDLAAKGRFEKYAAQVRL